MTGLHASGFISFHSSCQSESEVGTHPFRLTLSSTQCDVDMIGKNIDSVDKRSGTHVFHFPSHNTEVGVVKNQQYCVNGNNCPRKHNWKAFIMVLLTGSFLWCWLLFVALPTLWKAEVVDAVAEPDRREKLARHGSLTGDTQELSPVEHRLAALENTVTGLQSRTLELEQRNRDLELAVILGCDKPQHGGGKELEELVEQLERGLAFLFPDFTEVTQHLNPEERSAKARVEVLRDYLSNRAAELAALRPDRVDPKPADDDGDAVPDFGMIGLALQQLSNQNAELRKKVEELNQRVGVSLEAGRGGETGEDVGNIVQEVLRDEDRFLDEAERGKAANTRKSAFSVTSTHPQLGLEGQAQSLTFDLNISNKGEDFNFGNNSFVCRIPGFYFFTFTLRTYSNRILGVALMKNDELQVSINTDEAVRSISSTQSTLLRLSAGDSVWLRMPASVNYGVYSDHLHYTTFSGFLVFSTTS
ncbi:uncharacterized protein LOC119724266 [Patiria miniata]|uniref:C1q domain-containing protein n=1 Tax=Patiria miniata TaxID=46514 RepID=A0A913ZHA4_PATMI|nr:uncharacterized protein LOC119724266 [Patiria miniata]